MSTDPLYHAWNCVGYEHVKTEVVDGALRVVVAKARGEPECAGCGSTQVTLEGTREVSLRAVPIGQTRVYLVLRLLMLRCRQCHVVRQEKFDLAAPRKSYTRQFAEYVLVLTRYMTLQDVAELLKVGWDLVKEILKQDLERRAALRSWKGVRRIAIDEIAVKKGHKYLTVVVDLDSGEALYTAEGHDHTSLEPFFKRLEAEGAKLEAIAVDMGTGYRKGIELYAPKDVAVIYDHFHIVSAMNAVISEVRRGEQNRLEGEGKRVLKGSRYLLLYGKETLADDPDKRTRLDALLAANEVLHKVWLLKEDLRTFWQQENKETAAAFVQAWILSARALGVRAVSRIARTIEAARTYILSWYDHPITTGPLEGLNNKIKVLKRTAYGYRDIDFFGLRILFLHQTKFNLTGV
ncbi:MAG: ISL3 family transposase [Sandaracinaceae bacterium]|jgi:transposase|nr:ISL3 family transposase [Sandaracinaceae bacterium]